jgi:uncharacterized protein involved in exopolysaccharide biosynthesis
VEARIVEFADFVRVVWRRIWLVVAAILVFTGAALAFRSLAPPDYRAEADVIAIPVGRTRPEAAAAVVEAPELIETYAQIAVSRDVLSKAAKDVGIESKVEDLKVASKPIPRTSIISIVAHDDDAETAAKLANAVVAAFLSNQGELIAPPIYEFSLLERATVPDSRDGLDLPQYGLLGGVAGFIVGICFALLFDYLIQAFRRGPSG